MDIGVRLRCNWRNVFLTSMRGGIILRSSAVVPSFFWLKGVTMIQKAW